MRSVDLVVETKLDRTPRVKQLSGMFDVPAQEKLGRGTSHGFALLVLGSAGITEASSFLE